jgi:hypothetical protein
MCVVCCRAVFLQRRSRELLDNDELQVTIIALALKKTFHFDHFISSHVRMSSFT